jgi:hypothetical protein
LHAALSGGFLARWDGLNNEPVNIVSDRMPAPDPSTHNRTKMMMFSHLVRADRDLSHPADRIVSQGGS